MNPADHASQGLTRSSNEQVHVWFNSPEFVWQSEFQWPKQISMQEIQDDDPEVRAEVKVHVTVIHEGIIERLESLISDWAKMKRVVAWILKYKKILISRTRHQLQLSQEKLLDYAKKDGNIEKLKQLMTDLSKFENITN